MYTNIGHLTAFACELTMVTARGIEGFGAVSVTVLLASAYLVSSGLVREWSAYMETHAPEDGEAPVEGDGVWFDVVR